MSNIRTSIFAMVSMVVCAHAMQQPPVQIGSKPAVSYAKKVLGYGLLTGAMAATTYVQLLAPIHSIEDAQREGALLAVLGTVSTCLGLKTLSYLSNLTKPCAHTTINQELVGEPSHEEESLGETLLR